MTDHQLFDLTVGYASFKNPVALAPMAGITDAEFAKKTAQAAGLIVIGAYNLDFETNEAAKRMSERGRKEFITEDPMELLESELEKLGDLDSVIAVNVRAVSTEDYMQAALLARKHNAILELDAHCRQPEITDLEAGEELINDSDKLKNLIQRIKRTGVVLSVKIRANVVENTQLARMIEAAGADILHFDAMGTHGADLRALRDVRDVTNLFLIGNNSIRDFEAAKEMYGRGADMISVARGVLENPELLNELAIATTALQRQTGWYNVPKHLCGGGDLRALTFCCLPVKHCAVHTALKKVGMTPRQFAEFKINFVNGTPLQYGDGTCFGSMAWCCKASKPCFLRDSVLDTIDLSHTEYTELKKRMADHILAQRKNNPLR
ncbi:methanogenesis marker 9 domain-containing protein [Methanosarcinales archaeon]|nr:MAG: methanogenesis marker 9 domain-containing protein [Methanosarcinales archaeon]